MNEKAKYELRKFIDELSKYRGRHTELVSVYVPAGYDLNKIISHLQQEQSTAMNIKSATTRKNVIAALERMIQHLKVIGRTPPNGLAVFSGNIAEKEGEQNIKVWSIEPPEPLKIRIYRCDKQFILGPLEEMIEARELYGLIVMDRRDAHIALLKGKAIVPLIKTHSEVPGKFKAGGQCLAPDTLVQLSDGRIVEIKELHNPNIVQSVDFEDFCFEKGRVVDKWENEKEALRIITKYPRLEVECSLDHVFFVLSDGCIEEKRAIELKVGDMLVMPKKININKRSKSPKISKPSEVTRPPQNQAEIPEEVLKGPDRFLAKFLRSIFDVRSEVHEEGIRTLFQSKKLAKQTQIALLRFGILASFYSNGKRVYFLEINDKESLKRFCSQIGFSSQDQRSYLLKLLRNRAEDFIQRSSFPFLPVEISQIKRLGKKARMVDISVDRGNFIANGLIVHNSAQRFHRLIEGAAKAHYKKVAEKAKEQFYGMKELKGIIVGGPGPTKYDFVEYLPTELKRKVIAIKDTSYTGEFGLHELVEKSKDVLAKEEIIREKELMGRFFDLLAKKPGMVAYGEDEVMELLKEGFVDVVLISEVVPGEVVDRFEAEAVKVGSKVEIISTETREGVQLKEMGGIAAILRFERKEE